MQASTLWRPPAGTLGEILAETRQRLASLDSPKAGGKAARAGSGPSFFQALRRTDVAIIAEVKRRSPSKGAINPGLDAADQAARYEEGGAAAVSILTEPGRFGGSADDLRSAASRTRLPLLKKDFHISAVQLDEAREIGACAVLLIARAVPPAELTSLAHHARALGLEPVVEVRTDAELAAALDADARVIGVNSRDLETLEIDESVPGRLIPGIPGDVIAIWESGVKTVDDVRRAAVAGADAVLVGSALSGAASPEALLAQLTGVARKPRA